MAPPAGNWKIADLQALGSERRQIGRKLLLHRNSRRFAGAWLTAEAPCHRRPAFPNAALLFDEAGALGITNFDGKIEPCSQSSARVGSNTACTPETRSS